MEGLRSSPWFRTKPGRIHSHLPKAAPRSASRHRFTSRPTFRPPRGTTGSSASPSAPSDIADRCLEPRQPVYRPVIPTLHDPGDARVVALTGFPHRQSSRDRVLCHHGARDQTRRAGRQSSRPAQETENGRGQPPRPECAPERGVLAWAVHGAGAGRPRGDYRPHRRTASGTTPGVRIGSG